MQRNIVRGYFNRHVPEQMVHRQLNATLLQRVRDDLKHCVCLGNRVDNCHMASWTIPRLVSLTVGRRMRMVELFHCAGMSDINEHGIGILSVGCEFVFSSVDSACCCLGFGGPGLVAAMNREPGSDSASVAANSCREVTYQQVHMVLWTIPWVVLLTVG